MKNSKLITLLFSILMLVALTACQDTMPQRSTINPSQTIGDETPPDDGPTEIVRPTNDIKWKNDFCICRDSKPTSYGTCASFCSGKNTNGSEILYANFNIGQEVQRLGFGSVHGWCTIPLETDTENTKCIIEAKDSAGNITPIDTSIASRSNSVTANVSGLLDENKTYILTLVEQASGARSNSVQVIKFSEDIQTPILGPLKLNPITQYACIIRRFSTVENTSDVYYDNAYRMHFYFQPRTPPLPITGVARELVCHDYQNPLYGEEDRDFYPRYEQRPGTFTLWDKSDPRFYDLNENGIAEVNEIIRQKVSHYGGSIPAGTNFFNPFTWAGSPELNTEAGNSSSVTELGLYMAPWIDQTTYRSYCLTSAHYQLNNPLFRALGDVIQVNTEGLYIGVKTGDIFTDNNGNSEKAPDDFILIRESELKQVWFHNDLDGTLKAPTDENVSNVAVYFYYPLNKQAPYVRSGNQRLYRVRGATELNQENISNDVSNERGTVSQYPPHDRRIGCIPKQ